MSDFDSMLWRPIRSGDQYENLLPKTYCKPTYVGEGLTDLSIDAMEDNILEYAWQTENLADVLQKQTLNSTALTIHEFLYNHFQYKADGSDQMLRSPACSWYTRKEGIDCKSYSIFASCLLLNMGITHYIRKIKQPSYEPDEFTHVYIIVPTDQTNGSLNKGYYVIDGTIKQQKEPAFVGYKDLKMKHYSLNGTASQEDYPFQEINGLNGGVSLSELKNLSKKFSLNSIKSIWSKILCGSSAFTESMSRVSLANIDIYFQEWQVKFNLAIQNNDNVLASALVAEFKGRSASWLAASEKKVTQGYNSCTTNRIKANIAAFKFYKEVVGQVLTAYMEEYFNPIAGTFPQNATFSNEGSEAPPFSFHFTHTEPFFTNTQPKQLYQFDIKVNIPAFSIPEYVSVQANSGIPIDLAAVLGFIEAAGGIIKAVAPASSSGSGSGSYTPVKTIPGKGDSVVFTPIGGGKTSNAGLTTFAGVGILLLGLGIAFSKMKNKGPGATEEKSTK